MTGDTSRARSHYEALAAEAAEAERVGVCSRCGRLQNTPSCATKEHWFAPLAPTTPIGEAERPAVRRTHLMVKIAAYEVFQFYNSLLCALHGHPYTQRTSTYRADNLVATVAYCSCGNRSVETMAEGRDS